MYEQKLEQKNERIKALESKNQKYLDIISEREIEMSRIHEESTVPLYDHLRNLTKNDNLQISRQMLEEFSDLID